MYKRVRKFIAVAAISVSLSTPSLAQVINPQFGCRDACTKAFQFCIQRAPNAYARSICAENYVECTGSCSPIE
jgi:hypothetical protein